MMVRGGGSRRVSLAFMPKGRMGPPSRSFAADAHSCIMVRVLAPTEYKVVARSRPIAGSPLIVIPIAPSVPSCSKLSRCGLAKAEHAARLVRRPTLTAPAHAGVSEARVGTKKRALGRTKKLTGRGRARRGRYGDLTAADREGGCEPSDRWRALGRLTGRSDLRRRGTAGAPGEDWRARTGVDGLLLRAPSWPVENQLRRQAALRRRGSGVVMRCRS